GIVEADGDEVRRPRHAGAEPGIAFHQRQLVDVGLLDLGETGGRERVTVDVLHDLGEVADLAVLVDDSGLLFAGRAEADELHGFSPYSTMLMVGWIGQAS